MVIDRVFGQSELTSTGPPQVHAVAYVASGDTLREGVDARKYLDFFLLLYSYVASKRVLMFGGLGTNLKRLEDLGTQKFSHTSYTKISSTVKEPHPLWDKGVIKTKELFLELEPDREKIMNCHLGLALRFYYLAVSAAERMSRDEFIVHLTITTEALIQTDGKLTQNIRRRMSALIGTDSSDRKEVYRSIGKLYGVRSKVVHGHKPKIKIAETKQLDGYVRRAIEDALKLRHLSKKELTLMLDERMPEKSRFFGRLANIVKRLSLKHS